MYDCGDLLNTGRSTSGVYNIRVAGKTVSIWCDMTSEEGWLVSVICRLTFRSGYREINLPLCAFRTQSYLFILSVFSFWSLHILLKLVCNL